MTAADGNANSGMIEEQWNAHLDELTSSGYLVAKKYQISSDKPKSQADLPKNPPWYLRSKYARLLNDGLAFMPLGIWGLIGLGLVGGPTVFIVGFASLALAGIADIYNSGLRLRDLKQKRKKLEENADKNSVELKKVNTDIGKQWAKIITVDVPLIAVGVSGAVAASIGLVATVGAVLIGVSAVLTIGAAYFAGANAYKWWKAAKQVKETKKLLTNLEKKFQSTLANEKSLPSNQQLVTQQIQRVKDDLAAQKKHSIVLRKKFIASSVLFGLSASGLVCSILIPHVAAVAGGILGLTAVVAAGYWGYNAYKAYQQYKKEAKDSGVEFDSKTALKTSCVDSLKKTTAPFKKCWRWITGQDPKSAEAKDKDDTLSDKPKLHVIKDNESRPRSVSAPPHVRHPITLLRNSKRGLSTASPTSTASLQNDADPPQDENPLKRGRSNTF